MTRFGKILRNLRMDKGLLLKQMADFLNVSSAFLSAVENGKKKVPKGWVEKIARQYDLTPIEKADLSEAADENIRSVKINFQDKSSDKIDLALAFARKIDGLDAKTVTKLIDILK